VVVGEVQLQHLAGRQVKAQRLGDLVSFIFGRAGDPDAARSLGRAQGAPGPTERLRPGRKARERLFRGAVLAEG
jgi:hypothetical protein